MQEKTYETILDLSGEYSDFYVAVESGPTLGKTVCGMTFEDYLNFMAGYGVHKDLLDFWWALCHLNFMAGYGVHKEDCTSAFNAAQFTPPSKKGGLHAACTYSKKTP